VLIIVDMQRKSDLEKEVNNLTKEIDILVAKAQALSADDDEIRAKIEEFTKRIVLLRMMQLM
jgi:prefoldin subunit 5